MNPDRNAADEFFAEADHSCPLAGSLTPSALRRALLLSCKHRRGGKQLVLTTPSTKAAQVRAAADQDGPLRSPPQDETEARNMASSRIGRRREGELRLASSNPENRRSRLATKGLVAEHRPARREISRKAGGDGWMGAESGIRDARRRAARAGAGEIAGGGSAQAMRWRASSRRLAETMERPT